MNLAISNNIGYTKWNKWDGEEMQYDVTHKWVKKNKQKQKNKWIDQTKGKQAHRYRE